MKGKYLIVFVFLFLASFICFSNVDALAVDSPTLKSVERYTSNSVSVNYELSNCTQSNCGILVMNETLFKSKAASSIVLRNKNDTQLIWQNLSVGKTYKFRVAVYWFDSNGIMNNGKWSDALSVVVGSPTSKTATDMVITSGPSKTIYTAGETFDPSGMKISVIYNDGTNATISNGSGCSFSPSTLTSGTTKVAVTCEGQTAYQTVTVNSSSSSTVTVCTPNAPKITKNEGSNDSWANSLAASGGTNCGTPYYKWSLNENFTSPVIGTTYSKDTDGVTQVYAKACYGAECSSATMTKVNIDTSAPACTVSYYKNANGTAEDYTCGTWTKYGIFGRVDCIDNASGLYEIAYEIDVDEQYGVGLYSSIFASAGVKSGYAGRSTYTSTTDVDRVNDGEVGIHYHYGYAIDYAGNEYTSNKCEVMIDRKAPVGGTATADNSTKGMLVWNLTEISDSHSGLGEYRLEYREPGETAWTTVGLNNTTNAFVSSSTTNFTSVPAIEVSRECDTQMAAYEWRVIREDVAGNSNNSEIFKKACPSS